MKKAELTKGERYWISTASDWQKTGNGRMGEYTGRSEGLDAIFSFPPAGPDDDGLEPVKFVHVRLSEDDANAQLSGLWENKKVVDAHRESFRKRGQFLGLTGLIGVSEQTVSVTWADFDRLTRLAKAGLTEGK